MKRALALLLSLLLSAVVARATEADALKAGVFTPPHAAPAFALAGSDGAPLTLERYRGKVVALAFGFSHCADVCPVTLATLVQARKLLGPQGSALQVVYITVDPERDDAATLKAWLAAFDTSFIGGTGSKEALAAVDQRYGVSATRVATAGGYAIGHSSSVYLIDGDGRLRAMMPYGHAAEDYAHDVRLLMRK